MANRNEDDRPARGANYDQNRGRYDRDTNEQSGSTGRHAGYGDWGQGEYDDSGRSANTGQNRYGQSGYGGGDQPGQGGQGQSNYRRDDGGDPGRSRGSDSGYGYGGYASEARRQRGWNEPGGNRAGSGQSSGYGGPSFGGSEASTPYGYGTSGLGSHRGKGPKGYQRSDERVKEMISERLRDDHEVDASEITVNVSGGKVTLEGTVDSRRAKNAAEDIAEQCGCEDVQNNLRVERAADSATGGGESGKSTSGSTRQRH